MRRRLQDLIRRVQAIALVQERLYLSGDYAEVEMSKYLDDLATTLLDGQEIALNTALDELRLPIRRAIPLGLLANELIVNATKHAFAGVDQPRLELRFARGNEIATLRIADNGVGIRPGQQETSRHGLRLARSLASQLAGTLELEAAHTGGTVATLRFPLSEA
jgi:two-component sensor histidine kinase